MAHMGFVLLKPSSKHAQTPHYVWGGGAGKYIKDRLTRCGVSSSSLVFALFPKP